MTQPSLSEALNRGVTLQALLDIAPADLDRLYAYACQHFERGDHAGAKKLLLLLTRLSHWQFDYWLALGLSCQRLAEHQEAVHSFSQAAQIRMADPRSAHYAGLSLMALGQHDIAAQSFAAALNWCRANPAFPAIEQQSQQMLARCRPQEPQ